jgi:hypothetical protein
MLPMARGFFPYLGESEYQSERSHNGQSFGLGAWTVLFISWSLKAPCVALGEGELTKRW